MGDELRLIGGKQAIHSHTQTANIEDLMQITKDYDLTRVWMNADTAARRGIADGDEVEVSNGQHTGRVRVKVTQRINPTALYMPSHYGCSFARPAHRLRGGPAPDGLRSLPHGAGLRVGLHAGDGRQR